MLLMKLIRAFSAPSGVFIGRALGRSNIYGVPAVSFALYMAQKFVHSLNTNTVYIVG